MDEGSQTLTELLSESLWLPIISRQKGRERVVTALSAILSGTVASGKVFLAHEAKFLFPRQTSRMSFLSRQGTPVGPSKCAPATAHRNRLGMLYTPHRVSLTIHRHKSLEKLTPLLNALTSPSRMMVDGDDSSSPRSIGILSSLVALAKCTLGLFFGTRGGEKAIMFTLESVLMGCGYNDAESDDVSFKSAKTPSFGHRAHHSMPKMHLTPQPSASLLENMNLSLACRRLCVQRWSFWFPAFVPVYSSPWKRKSRVSLLHL